MVDQAICPSTGPTDLAGVEDLFEAWVEAVRSRDADRVAGLHLSSGVFQFAGGGAARGSYSIRRFCADWLCREDVVASFALLETRLYGTADIATGNGRFTLAGPPGANGNGKIDSGRLLLVAEKDLDRWGLRFSGLFSDAYLDELATFRL